MTAMPNDAAQEKLTKLLGYLEADPENYSLLCEAGDVALQIGDKENARPLLEKALSLQSNDHGAMYRMAVLLFLENRHEESLALTQAILDSGEQHPVIQHRHALSLVQLGRFEEAVPLFAQLAADTNTFPDVPHQYIRSLHYTGELDEATDFVRSHLAQHPDDTTAKGMLSLLCIDQEDFKQAGKLAAETLQTSPDNLDALLAGGTAALAYEDQESAQLLFERAAAIRPNNGRAWLGLGLASMLQNDLDNASRQFEKTVQCMPKHLGSWNTLAWIHILNRNPDAAEKALQQANAVDHNFSETYGGLAVVAALRGEWEEVKTLSDTALKLDKESFSGRFAQSLLIEQRGRPEQAGKLINGILENMTVPGGGNLKSLITRHAVKMQSSAKNRTLH